MAQGFRRATNLRTHALPLRSSGVCDSLVGSLGAPDGPAWVPGFQIRDALGRALEAKNDLEDRLDRKNHVVQELLARIDKLEQRLEDGTNKASSSKKQSVVDIEPQGETVTVTAELRNLIENSEGDALREAALQSVTRLESVERQLVEALQDNAQLSARLSGITIASAELEKVMKEDVKSGGSGSPEIPAVLPLPEASRGSNISDDDMPDSASRSLKRDSKGSSSGGRSSRTVTISAVQFRNLRRDIRELTAEKEMLQEQCELNKGREAGFYNELHKLQEELAGALQHKAALAREFREFGHVRERLSAEVEALKEALDEEHIKASQIEEALEEFRSLHVDLISIVDAGAEPVEDDEIPAFIPDCIRFWAARVREDMVPLVSSSAFHGTDARAVRTESPSLANVVVTAQAHAELDEPQPSPSRRSNIDSRSHMMTVLKNDVRDLREHDLDDGSRLATADQGDEGLHQSEALQARCEELHGARRQLDDVIGSKAGTRGAGEDWEGEDRDSIYGDSGTEGMESASFDRLGQQDLHHSLQVKSLGRGSAGSAQGSSDYWKASSSPDTWWKTVDRYGPTSEGLQRREPWPQERSSGGLQDVLPRRSTQPRVRDRASSPEENDPISSQR